MLNSFQIQLGLSVAGYPTVAASLVLGVARLAKPASAARRCALVAAATAGLLTSYLGLSGLPKVPPVDSIGWVPVGTLCAGLVGVAFGATAGNAGARQRAVVMAIALVAVIAAFLAGKPVFAQSIGRFLPFGLGAALISAQVVANAPGVAQRGSAVGGWLALLCTAVLAALCALWGASASLAMLLGSMAATAGVLGIGGLILHLDEPTPTAQGVFIVHMSALLTYAHLFANLPILPLVLLAASLLAPTVSRRVPGTAGRRRWLRAVVVVAAAIVLAGSAAAIMHGEAGEEAAM